MSATLSIASLVLGGFFAASNWCFLCISLKSAKFVSVIPLLGGLFLVLGLLGFHQTRPFAWAGLLADYGTLVFLFAIPTLIHEAWQTSRWSLLHKLTGQKGAGTYDVRLFQKSVFTIRCLYNPPVPCNAAGVLAQSRGFQGTWREEDDGFCLENYAATRVLHIRRTSNGFISTEDNYPPDVTYPYDSLDGLELTEA